eukprot:TRINITY_DN7266_c0_g1_i1.p1 TRINITY_DN7266_c0_g1~~TRINITY_DN7266_c0_g1_i1.p1  ORF type:complete len:972 (-),score=394.79 TRINITY_DN7266_c0_g1_i1:120-3035(-)
MDYDDEENRKENREFIEELMEKVGNLSDHTKRNIVELIKEEVKEIITQQFSDQKNSFKDIPRSSLSLDSDRDIINLSDLFRLNANSDEILSLSFDQSTGKQKNLSEDQLKQIKREASFQLPSVEHPNQFYRFKLSLLLQEGSDVSRSILNQSLASSLRDLSVKIPNLLFGPIFSVFRGLINAKHCLFDLFDLFIGMPRLRCRLSSEYEDRLSEFRRISLEAKDKDKKIYKVKDNGRILNLAPWQDEEIEFELKNCFASIENRVNAFMRENHSNFIKELLKSHETEENLSKEEAFNIAKRELQAKMREKFVKEIENATDSKWKNEFLLKEFKLHLFIQNLRNESDEKKQKEWEETTKKFRREHPIKSLISEVEDERWREFDEKWRKINDEEENKRVKEYLRAEGYYERLFIIESLESFEEKNPNLREKLSKQREPVEAEKIPIYIWQKKNWKIERIGDHSYLEKYDYVNVSSSYPFWKWTRAAVRSWSIFKYINGTLWDSLVSSFKFLFKMEEFTTEYCLDEENKEIVKDKSRSRIPFFFMVMVAGMHIHLSRKDFEEKPDFGIMGKGMMRPFNLIWNYLFEGTALVPYTVLTPPTVILKEVINVFLMLTSPAWTLAATDAWILFELLINDNLNWFPLFHLVLWRFLICSVMMGGYSLVNALIYRPISSLFKFVFGNLRFGLRRSYDWVIFHLIKNRLRIPQHDTFLCRTVAAPGLSSQFYYQVTPALAILLFQNHLDKLRLSLYQSHAEKKIREPGNVLKNWFDSNFNQLGLFRSLSFNSNTHFKASLFESIERREQILCENLRKRMETEYKKMPLRDSPPAMNNIKLKSKDLELVLEGGEKLLGESFDSLTRWISSKDFWMKEGMEEGDYRKLTEKIYGTIFGTSFLSPLEEADESFYIQVDHVSTKKYLNMITTAEFRDDLEQVRPKFVVPTSFELYNTVTSSFASGSVCNFAKLFKNEEKKGSHSKTN